MGSSEKISKIGLGTWQFGAREWGYGEQYAASEARAIVRRALELGVTFFDTAEIYASGRSERILGQALDDDRESAFLATKLFPVVPSTFVVKWQAAASARRLGTSRIDLYQAHYPNPLVSDATIMRGMRSLQREGLIGEVGISNYSAARWQSAEHALGSRILSNQVEYNLLNRAAERSLLPFAEARDRMIISFSPLAQGLLTGRYHGTSRPTNAVRATSANFSPENLRRTDDLISTLREVADAHAASPSQIALAWVIHHPAVAAIPGASSVAQIESNVAAADMQLRDEEYRALNDASARAFGAPEGDTFPRGDINEPPVRSALKHSAKGGWYVAKTIWSDHRPKTFPGR